MYAFTVRHRHIAHTHGALSHHTHCILAHGIVYAMVPKLGVGTSKGGCGGTEGGGVTVKRDIA